MTDDRERKPRSTRSPLKRLKKESEPVRSVSSLTPDDEDFASAVAGAGQAIRLTKTWGDTLDDEVRVLAEAQTILEDARKTGTNVFEAAQQFRAQEAKVNEMLQKRLAAHIKEIR